MSHGLPALVTALTVLLLMATMILVGRARGRHGIKAPTMSGPPEFERTIRIQANSNEAALMFLPSLWLFALYFSSVWAGALGLIWLLGRLLFAVGYARAAEKRTAGFVIAFAAQTLLLLGAIIGLFRAAL
jgi:glutathione S-transferase